MEIYQPNAFRKQETTQSLPSQDMRSMINAAILHLLCSVPLDRNETMHASIFLVISSAACVRARVSFRLTPKKCRRADTIQHIDIIYESYDTQKVLGFGKSSFFYLSSVFK
jgi:hypothetical protein